ncbi:hypothetical protein THAOC_00699, partial [Thalassiosira oceanica]
MSSSTSTATPCFRAKILFVKQPGRPQIQRVYSAMNPLLAYTLAPMHLSAFYIPRGSGKTTWEPTSTSTSTATPCLRTVEKQPWEPTSTSTSTATPCFRADISGSEPPASETPILPREPGRRIPPP